MPLDSSTPSTRLPARRKIEALTPEQEADLVRFHAEYLAAGRSCEPADRPRAEVAFARAYRAIGREPVPVIWVASPLSANVLHASLRTSLRTNLRTSPYASLRTSLRTSLRDSLEVSLEGSLEASLEASLRDSLEVSLGGSLWASLWASLEAGLRDSLGSKIPMFHTDWRGQQDIYWIAFYEFCRRIGVPYKEEDSNNLDIVNEIGQSCMWWYPGDGLIVACEREAELHLDDTGRLHNQRGPSWAFRDGWKLHHWHGVAIPEDWTSANPNLTAADALRWPNIEQRRAACEILGWARILRELNAETIDTDPDPEIGELLRVDIPDIGRECFLRVRCGTGREFALPVPPNMRTALEANAWTYDITDNLLKLKEHRT